MPRRQAPTDKPEVLTVPSITSIKTIGRPPIPKPPKKPNFHFEEEEQERYDWFIHCVQSVCQDLSDFDQLILELAGVTYIKLLRMNAKEIEDGQLITMARQNPNTDFMRYIDILFVSRKQRQRATSAPDTDREDELLRILSGAS